MKMLMVVLKLNTRDLKDRTQAMSIIASFGVESVVANKEGVLTVIGNVDPVVIVGKLRKKWDAQIVSVVPAYEQEEMPMAQPQWTLNRNYEYYDYNYEPYEDTANSCVIS